MAKSSVNVSRTDIPPKPSATDKGNDDAPPKLSGMDSNPQGAFGPRVLAGVSRHGRAPFTTRCRCRTRRRRHASPLHPHLSDAPRGPDALSGHGVHHDAGARRGRTRRRPAADPCCSRRRGGHRTVPDGAGAARPAMSRSRLCAAVPERGDRLCESDDCHCRATACPRRCWRSSRTDLSFRAASGAARLIGAAMQEFYAQADDLTVSEAEAAVEGIVALTTACARARLAGDEADHVKSRRKAALDYIDAHLGERAAWARRDRRGGQSSRARRSTGCWRRKAAFAPCW